MFVYFNFLNSNESLFYTVDQNDTEQIINIIIKKYCRK